MSAVAVSITIPWFGLPLVLDGHASICTLPPGSTILSSKEPKPTPDGLLVEFSYDDGKDTTSTMSVGGGSVDGEIFKADAVIEMKGTITFHDTGCSLEG